MLYNVVLHSCHRKADNAAGRRRTDNADGRRRADNVDDHQVLICIRKEAYFIHWNQHKCWQC